MSRADANEVRARRGRARSLSLASDVFRARRSSRACGLGAQARRGGERVLGRDTARRLARRAAGARAPTRSRRRRGDGRRGVRVPAQTARHRHRRARALAPRGRSQWSTRGDEAEASSAGAGRSQWLAPPRPPTASCPCTARDGGHVACVTARARRAPRRARRFCSRLALTLAAARPPCCATAPSPTAPRRDGRCALHACCVGGRADCARLLVSHGASVRQPRTATRTSRLHARGIKGHFLRIVRLLLAHGADLRVRDEDGVTPLHWAAIGTTCRAPAAARARRRREVARPRRGATTTAFLCGSLSPPPSCSPLPPPPPAALRGVRRARRGAMVLLEFGADPNVNYDGGIHAVGPRPVRRMGGAQARLRAASAPRDGRAQAGCGGAAGGDDGGRVRYCAGVLPRRVLRADGASGQHRPRRQARAHRRDARESLPSVKAGDVR